MSEVDGWVLHVAREGDDRSAGWPRPDGAAGHPGARGPAGAGNPGLRGPTHLVGAGGWLRSLRDAVRIARRLRRRPDPAEATVWWPEAGPVPVVHAHDAAARRAAWLALCLGGAPARLTAVWDEERPPPDGGIWRRCDLALAGSAAAARALRAAGLAGRRIRVVGSGGADDGRGSGDGPARGDALLRVYRELWSAPLVRARRVDWSLR